MKTARSSASTVLLTDYAWADISVERGIIEGAGFRLVTGPSIPVQAAAIESLVHEQQPVAIMTCWAEVSEHAILAARELRVVARMGVGLDNIAVNAATKVGAWVTNVPDYCVEEVSDHAVGMVLTWARGLLTYDREVRQGIWNPAGARLRRVATLTCGVLGYGHIGQRTAAKLMAFGARILAHSRSTKPSTNGIEHVSLDKLLCESDVVIVHVPLTDSTHYLINSDRLAQMKKGAFLVNVSRGSVVDTKAIIAALDSGRLSGAALDVLDSEPQVPATLLAHPGVTVTPHIAFLSDASLLELRRRACEEVVRVLRGELPHHPCNRPDRLAAPF